MKKEYLAPTAKRLNYYANENICCNGSSAYANYYDTNKKSSRICWPYYWTPSTPSDDDKKKHGYWWW